MPTLILLGGAGGVLRGVLDMYIQFVNWRSDRAAHRQPSSGREGEPPRELPRFKDYFDPAVDSVAALVHGAMGAGVAVLLGTTGQVSGPYAALVVGISAPVILTQLARIQSVSDAVTGGPPTPVDAAGTGMTPQPAPPARQPAVADPGVQASATAVLGGPSAPGVPAAAAPDLRTAASQRDGETSGPQQNGRPVDPAGGPERGGHGTGSPLRNRPVMGEEGTP